MKMGFSINQIEEITINVVKESTMTKSRIPDWKKMNEQAVWVELVGCILGSRVPYENAISALHRLVETDLIDPNKILKNSVSAEKKISIELSKPIYRPIKIDGEGRKYRYPNIRARNICECAITLYSDGNNIKSLLKKTNDKYIRDWISSNCAGVGPKQASLFLRNIGYSQKLAIIDSHVLRYMIKKELIPESTHYNINRSQYYHLENTFVEYAETLGIQPGTLDLAIWAVMSQTSIGGAE